MRRIFTICLLAVLLPLLGHGQRTIWFAGRAVLPEEGQVLSSTRGHLKSLRGLGLPTNGQYNALVQLSELPSAAQVEQWARVGITLGDYLGGYSWWALVREGLDARRLGRATGIVSLVPVAPEWKLDAALQRRQIPDYARVGDSAVRVVIHYAPNATEPLVRQILAEQGGVDVELGGLFRTAYATVPISAVSRLASIPWVLRLALDAPSAEPYNYSGRLLGRAGKLNISPQAGGRGLLGDGVRIGIWDANVTPHVDFGRRVAVQEFELFDDHGSHVAGSVLGAGILDPDARGMAPKAKAWAYNFNKQRNGLNNQQEMAQATQDFGITLTQNSYGIYLRNLCGYINLLGYKTSDYNLDYLVGVYPTLTHIFAAGNDQGSCTKEVAELYGKPGYGTATTRAKNALYVGAVDELGAMSTFSSWGPQDDGRLFPTICAKGVEVYSTISDNGYGRMDGTSMACPTVTGHAALVSERYAQLHSGASIPSALLRGVLANTATDGGRPGPDFQYGYGIMNAERAVEAIEQGWYWQGELEADGKYSHTITIPKGCSGVRVMLVWDDLAVAKAVDYGQKALVNNLDLSLSVGDASFLPWVCNPTKGHVEDLASRGVDTLNNLEQVTLTPAELNGSPSVVVNVVGKEVAGKQGYVLTWYFDKVEPRVVAPADGMVLVPGQGTLLIVEGIETPAVAELTYDGGENWQFLAKLSGAGTEHTYSVRIPTDAPLTAKAHVRVVDANGRVARSTQPFVIAPQPKNLRVEGQSSPCSTDNAQLVWDEETLAKNGYAVLLADPDAEEVFRQIGTTPNASSTTFTIPAGVLEGVKRPVLSVAALLADGKTYGKRAVGVEVQHTQPVRVNVNDLPFSETFTRTPSVYISLSAGANVEGKYVYTTLPGLPQGSSLYGITCTQDKEDFDTTNYFSPSNADNQATISLCEVDLSGVHGESVYLHLSGMLDVADEGDLTTAQMRVKAGVEGKDILASLDGSTVQQSNGYDQDWYFELPTGVKHRMAIEFAGKGKKDGLVLSQIALERSAPKPAVELTLLNAPKDGGFLSKETFRLMLSNLSTKPIKNLWVKAYRNGEWVNAQHFEELKGRESRLFNLTVDLSTTEQRGEMMAVKFECVADPLNPQANATATHTVYSMGRVVPMPYSETVTTMLGPVTLDPKLSYTVGEKIYFTDDGGMMKPHSPQQESTIKFLPADPGMKIRVLFRRFSTIKDAGTLSIFTVDTPTSLDPSGERERAILTGDTLQFTDAPLVYISEAADGGVLMKFVSAVGGRAFGWIAEVEQVYPKNPLTLTGVEAVHRGNEEEAEIPVTLHIFNRWLTEQKGVTANVIGRNEFLITESLPPLAPGENVLTLSKKLRVKRATPLWTRVAIDGEDTNGKDNTLVYHAVHDGYCIPTNLPETGYYDSRIIRSIRAYDSVLNLSMYNTGAMRYTLDSPLKIYRGDGEIPLTVTLKGNIPEGWKLTAWVDWDGNLTFDERERVECAVGSGYDVTVTLPLHVSPDCSLGLKRMRLMLASASETGGPCKSIKDGDIQDCAISLMEGTYPNRGDLALTKLDVGESGQNLSATQPLKLTLTNRSDSPFNGKVQVLITVDNGVPVTEELDCTGDGALEAYSGNREFALATTGDFHSVGTHTVRAVLQENPVVVNENNTIEASAFCVLPEVNGLYSLAIRSLDGSKEYVEANGMAEWFGDADFTEWTVETIFRIDRPQTGILLYASGFKVFTTYQVAAGVPDNALAIEIGEEKRIFTEENTLVPGKWHHLAIAVSDIKNSYFTGRSCKVSIYLDGQECSIARREGEDIPRFDVQQVKKLAVCGKMDANLKLLRGSTRALTADAIKWFDYVRTAGGLPSDYFAEFTFDEGPRNAASVSGDMMVSIATHDASRLDATSGGIWEPIADLIDSFHFAGQEGYNETGANAYTIRFAKGTPQAHVVGAEFVGIWPGVNFYYGGQPITKTTVFDFTTPVTVVAKGKPFGRKEITQSIELTFMEGKSAECELLTLSLEPANNAGLLNPVIATPAPITVISIPSANGKLTDPTKVKLNFTVSENATLQLNGRVLTNGVTAVDITQPILLYVVAENGTRRGYELHLGQEQGFTWTLAKTDYVYGDGSVDAGVSVDSGLPVNFTSTNPTVVTGVDGKLHIGMPGEAVLSVSQPGGGVWNPSESVQKSFTVAKRPVKVAVRNARYTFGSPVEMLYNYTSLVNESDTLRLPNPQSNGCFTVHDAKGNAMDVSGVLPIGLYTVKTATGTAYETERYLVEPVEGVFEVVQGELWPVSVVVTDGVNPLQDATVIVGSTPNQTDAAGRVVCYLRQGAKYGIEVLKDGYTTVLKEADLTEGKPIELQVALGVPTIPLKYSAPAEMGVIVGPAEQRVAKGADAESVMALPKPGYLFERWSDGKMDNPRQDRAITTPCEIQAEFKAIELSLSYSAAEGGRIARGATSQSVKFNGDGTEVVAEPLEGYYFRGWSDGGENPGRKDLAVKSDISVVALFGKYMPLPERNGFEQGNFGEGWYTVSSGPTYNPWFLTTESQTELPKLEGTFAACNTKIMPMDSHTVSDLYSPRYLLDEGWNSELIVSQTYAYQELYGEVFAMQIRVGEGAWTDVRAFTPVYIATQAVDVIPASELAGKRFFQLRWHYDAEWRYAVEVDNVAIAKPKPAAEKVTIAYEAVPKDAGTFDMELADGTFQHGVAEQEVNQGDKPLAVKAIPAAEYKFVRWEDGGTDATLRLNHGVYSSYTQRAIFRGTDSVAITYRVVPEGTATFMVDGKQTALQTVVTGSVAKPVTVVPNKGYGLVFWSDNGDTELVHAMGRVDADATITAYLQPVYPVIFEVKDANGLLSGAVVTVGDVSKNTATDGKANLELPNGDYTFTVAKEGYTPTKGTLTVASKPQEIMVVLEKNDNPNPPKPPIAVDGGALNQVLAMPNPFVGELTLTGMAMVERVELLNAQGVVEYAQSLQGEERVVLRLPNLSAGLYLLVLKGQGQQKTLRIVKQ